MIPAPRFVDALSRHGFGLYAGVPCSYLTPLIDYVIADPALRYVGATNEGDAVAIGAGAELGGRPAVAMFQNSGLGNAISPLTSLTWTFRIPVLLVVTWRGEPGGTPDEPQHDLMGAITPRLLDAMRIPWQPFPTRSETVDDEVGDAARHLRNERTPFAFVMSKGSVAAVDTPTAVPVPPAGAKSRPLASWTSADRLDQDEALSAIQAHVDPRRDIIIATTGYTGRALEALADRSNQLYMVGSMGCASSFGLGLALVQPTRRVIVIDGDGAALMRLGALSTIGHEAPPNLVHVLLDNGVHDSTGSQPTTASHIDLALVASAAGYQSVHRVASTAALGRYVAERADGPRFVHVRTRPREHRSLPRPATTPTDVASRLRAWVAS